MKWEGKVKFSSLFRPYLNAKKIIKSLSFHFSFSCSLVSTLLFALTHTMRFNEANRSRLAKRNYIRNDFSTSTLDNSPHCLSFFSLSTLPLCAAISRSWSQFRFQFTPFYSLSMLKVINCNVQINKILRTESNVCSAARIRSLYTANTARASLTL